MYCIKKPESGKRLFLISIILLFLCMFLHTSCPAGTPEMYKLELNGGGSVKDAYTRVIYYSPIEKAWYEDIDGRNKITTVPLLPSGEYTVRLYYNDAKIAAIKQSEIYKTEIVKNDFLGYKIGSELCIDKDGNIKEGFKISRHGTAIADFDASKNLELPTKTKVNEELSQSQAIRDLQYEFIGWSPTKDWTESDDRSIAVNSNIDLYASYKPIGTYVLSIDWNGATMEAADKVYYKTNKGWYKDESLSEELKKIEIPEKIWTINYDRALNDGEPNPESQTVRWSFENIGGENSNYLKDVEGTWNSDRTISSDITVKAEWSTNDKITFRTTSAKGHNFSVWGLSTDMLAKQYKAGTQINPEEVESDVRNGVLLYKAIWDDERIIHVYLNNNGATNAETDMLYYFRSDKAWHKTYDDTPVERIVIPEKKWTVNFISGFSDVVNPLSLTSVWTFDGYADENGTRWIKADGSFADSIPEITKDVELEAKWIKQTTIALPVESAAFKKGGKIFKGWTLDGTGVVLPGGEYKPQTQETRLVASWENMKYAVSLENDSYGTLVKPIDGIKKLLIAPSGINVVLTLSNLSVPQAEPPVFTENITDVRGWFEAVSSVTGFSKDLIDSVYTVAGFSDDRTKIFINISGALDAPVSSSIYSSDIRVPSAAIKDCYDSSPVTTSLYYRVSGEVQATIEDGENDKGEKYYGSSDNPVVGDPGKALGDGNGVLIKVKVKNALLRQNLKEDDVKKWFKNINVWFANDNINVSIDTSASYSDIDKASYITLRLKGTPSSEMNRNDTTISIPYSDFVGGAATSGSIEADIHYRSEKTPQIKMDSSVGFVGSSLRPFVATPGIYVGENGEGYTLRIDIGDKKFTNPALVIDVNSENNVVKGWFSASTQPGADFASVMGDKMEYRVLGGGYENKYIDIGITGYTEHNPQSQTTAMVSIANSDIGLARQGRAEIGVSYVVTDKVQAIVDTAPPYRGGSSSTDKRLRFPYYINTGNGDGERIKINLSNAVFSSNVGVNTDISSWITSASGFDMSSLKFVVTDGGNGKAYIVVNVTGYAVTDILNTDELKIDIPQEAIAHSSSSSLSVVPQGTLHYVAGIKAQAQLTDDPTSSYYGGQSNVLKTVPFTKLGSTGAGVQIEVTLQDSEGYEFLFSNNLNDEEVTKWFTTQTESSSFVTSVRGENLVYSYISGAGTKSVIVEIKGYITKDGISAVDDVPRIRIPESSIQASSSNLPIITSPLYITSTSQISTRLSSLAVPVTDGDASSIEEYYAGSAAKRLTGYDLMYLIRNNGASGIPMRIELKNAKWAQDLTNEDIRSWFSFTDVEEIDVQKTDFGNPVDYAPNGKKGSSYVTVLLNGYFAPGASSTAQSQDVPLSQARNYFAIPSSYLQNVSEDLPEENTKTVVFHSSTIITPTVEVASPPGYVGYEANPISGAENIYLGDRAGVKVMLRLLTEADKPIRFSSNITKEQIKNWLILPDVEVTDIDYHGFASYGSVTADSQKAIEFTIKGYFKSGTVPGAVKENSINLDYMAFADSTRALPPVEAKIYSKSSGPVELTLTSDNPAYRGSSTYPIEGTPYVAYGDNGNGIEVRLELKNAVFSSSFTSDTVKQLFNQFTIAVNGGEALTYTVKPGTGPLQNTAIIQIQGYSRAPRLNDSFALEIKPTHINSAASALLSKTVDIHYVTHDLEKITVSDERGFYGSSLAPINMTPYVRLGENGEGIKVRIRLGANTFKTTLTADRVKEWFNGFEREVGGEGTLQYAIDTASVTSGTKDLDITITGYVTKKNTSSSANITISYSDVDGTVSDFGDKQIAVYYAISNPVSVALYDGAEYYGTAIAPIRSVTNVVYGAGDGVKIKLALQNAKFSDEVILNYSTYTGVKNWFKDDDISTREYEITEVGSDKASLVIRVKGYDGNAIKKQYTYSIEMPYNAVKNAESSIETISCPIEYTCLGPGGATLSTGASYDGATALDPIIGRQNMLLTSSSTETPGVKIRIELTDLLFNTLPDDLTSLGWFNEFKAAYGDSLTFTKADGGEGMSYMDIMVNGYPTLMENTSQSAPITIPGDAIKGASASFESKTINIYYKTLDNVSAALSTEDTVFVGGPQRPLGSGLVKYIDFNNGTGVEVRLNLKNAKFKKEAVLSEQTLDDGSVQISVNPDFALLLTKGLPSAFKDLSVVYTNGGDNQSFIRFILKGYIADDFAESTGVIDIPYKYLLNGGPIDDENKKVQALWYYSPSGVSFVSASVSSTSEYSGANGRPIEGRPYVNLGSDGLGIKVRVEIKNALFGEQIASYIQGDTSSQNVKLWFRALDAAWNTSLKYTLVNEPGSGIGSNYAVINIEGVPQNTDVSAIRDNIETTLYIPGSHIMHSHFSSSSGEDITTSLWYSNKEGVSVEIESSSAYVGTEGNPFKATPFISVLDANNNPLKVMIKLKDQNLSFIGTGADGGLSDSDVSSWFTGMNTELSASSSTLKFTVERMGNNFVVVAISGYVTDAKVGMQGSFNVVVPYSNVKGASQGAGSFTVPMHYHITSAVRATVMFAGQPSSTTNAIEGYKDIYLNKKEGYSVRIVLENAKWAKLDTNSVKAIFSNMSTSGFEISGGDYKRIAGGENENYLDVLITGYPTASTGSTAVKLNIPAALIDSSRDGFVPLTPDLYVKSSVDLLSLSEADDYGEKRYATSTSPISGWAYIKLQNENGGDYRIRIKSDQARFKADITSSDIKVWLSAILDDLGKESPIDTDSSIIPSVVAEDDEGKWIDIAITGNFVKKFTGYKLIEIPTSAFRYHAQNITSLNINLNFDVNEAPSFAIESNTMQYAQYERIENASSPGTLPQNKRFKVSVTNGEFDSSLFGRSTEIKPSFAISENMNFHIQPIDANSAYIYASGRVDTEYVQAKVQFVIPKIVVKNAADNFAIKTVINDNALIDTKSFVPYFDVNETVSITSSDITTAISAGLSGKIYTTSFKAHNTGSEHINQSLKFYKVQKAVVPYMVGGVVPSTTVSLPYDYEIADTELTAGMYLAVLNWALSNGYTFYGKLQSGSTDISALELFGFGYGVDGNMTNRASTIDPVVGYPTTFRNAIVFCNAFTEWYNNRYTKNLEPVYRDSSGNVIKSYDFTNYHTDAAISANGGKNGFRLPSVGEWQYAAAISRDPLDNTYNKYSGTAVMPSLVYAQSYLDPSGYPANTTQLQLSDYIIYAENYGSTVIGSVDRGSQSVGKTTAIKREPNRLGLYDMSGNVAEWTTTQSSTEERYIVGGYVSSSKEQVTVGSVMTANVNDVTQIGNYVVPVGIRLVRSLR